MVGRLSFPFENGPSLGNVSCCFFFFRGVIFSLRLPDFSLPLQEKNAAKYSFPKRPNRTKHHRKKMLPPEKLTIWHQRSFSASFFARIEGVWKLTTAKNLEISSISSWSFGWNFDGCFPPHLLAPNFPVKLVFASCIFNEFSSCQGKRTFI